MRPGMVPDVQGHHLQHGVLGKERPDKAVDRPVERREWEIKRFVLVWLKLVSVVVCSSEGHSPSVLCNQVLVNLLVYNVISIHQI